MTHTVLGKKFYLESLNVLFNIFICVMFCFIENYEIANYANDSTRYSDKNNHKVVITELEQSSANLIQWLQYNYMNVNTEKSHILLSRKIKIDLNNDGSKIELKSVSKKLAVGTFLFVALCVFMLCK